MSNLIVIGLPILIFVIITTIGYILFRLWSNYFSAESKAKKVRFSKITSESNESKSLIDLAKKENSKVEELFELLPISQFFEKLVLRSGSKYSPLYVAIATFASFTFVFFLVFLILGGIVNSLMFGLLFGSIPILKLKYEERKRALKVEEQLPDALDYLARALLSGHGISYAITMLGDEFPPPIGQEFKVAAEQINYGVPFEDALVDLTNRVISTDLNFFVIALIVQRETGGNFAELLGIISSTIRERLKLKGKVRVLSSEARLSGLVLTMLPFFLAAVLNVINPEYMSQLWTTDAGHKMLGAAAIMIPLGIIWMRKLTQIRV